jgi:CRP-like cAMP-binding protein
MVFMRTSKFPVTAEALTDSVVYRIPNDTYRSLLHDNSDACMRLLSDVCRHLHQRVQEIEQLTIQNARSRLSSYLIDHADEIDDDEATIRLDLPKHVIASRLSITPETLSRLLRAMSKEGILTVDDRLIFVHSLARLRPYD